MDWSKGYASHWRVYEVDTDTWADAGEVSGIRSVTVERDGSGTAPLIESGTIKSDGSEPFSERYLRVALYAEQDSGAERVDVVTMLCCSTKGVADRGTDASDLNGRSVLYPASVRRVTSGTYAPSGADGVKWCADMLREAIAAPVETAGGFTIDRHIVFGIGSTYLECVWQVLDAGGYVIQIDGDGTVRILPTPSDASLILDEAGARLLHPSISYDIDWSDVPNRYTAIDGEDIAIAENDSPDSPTSTVSRGYVHDVVDTKPVRVNGETLAQYAARRLEEESSIRDVRTYSREYAPDVLPFSIVRGNLATIEIDGDLRVVSQSLTCDKGITVTEKSAKEVRLWTR